MDYKVRIPSPWSQLFLFAGLVLAMMVLFTLLYFVIDQIAHGSQMRVGAVLQDTASVDFSKFVQALFSLTVFGLTGFLYARFTFRDQPGYQLGLRPATQIIFYPLAILLLVFSLPLEEWLGELNKGIPLWHWMTRAEQDNDRQVETFLKVRHPFDPVVNVLVMAVIPAFCEELCFRGALQRIMIQICKRPLMGILVSAFLFSFFHFQFEGFLPRMFLGVLLGAAYWYSGSLWVPILAHFFFNAVQVVFAMVGNPAIAGSGANKNPTMPMLFVLASLGIVVGLLSLMRSLSTVSFAGVYGGKPNEYEDFLT
ncbi:MAG TPA: CPBP family intramembrane glutamic endopeptidase [Puia sp.]|nr:CPBP family intramembrane glutamic endopeptidase [Puia sp.]